MDENELIRATGLTAQQYNSICQVPTRIPIVEPYIDNICGIEVIAYLRMPPGIPSMPMCAGHLAFLLSEGWVYDDTVDAVALSFEAASPWEIEVKDDDA